MRVVCPPPVTGAGHMRDGTPCQDRVASDSGTVLGHSFTIIGVADGAGSKSYSHYGAETVLKVAVQELSDLRSLSQLVKNIHLLRFFCKLFRIKTLEDLWPDFANRLLTQMQGALEQQAVILGVPVNQLSTTCILALVVDDLLVAMRVGDGALVVRSRTGEISSAFPRKIDSYANETSFVTTRHVTPEIYIQRDIDGLLMSTDGVEPFFLNQSTGAPRSENVSAFLQVAKKSNGLEQITSWLNEPALKENTLDDLSLIIAIQDELDAKNI